jgi:hypothetical protein
MKCKHMWALHYYYYYFYYVFVVVVSRHMPFIPGTSLEPTVILTVQASSFRLQHFPYYVWCSKYSCFLSESIECFPGMASKYFFQPFVTIPVAPVITGIILHFRHHIRFISTATFLFFVFVFNYYIWPICRNFCVPLDSITLLLLLLLLLLLAWTLADSKQQNLSW